MANERLPDRDASLGLIFRLNHLWSLVDVVSVVGDYKKWNNYLDALYRNLLFDRDLITKIDEETKQVTKISFCESDIKSYKYLTMKVSEARRDY